jgi:glycosyltransferase involved in cell wall biosynthesis/SAM-dependent methyltransferase
MTRSQAGSSESQAGGTSSSDAALAVSVIIPCYNLGAYLDDAVQSVLAQTYQDFEIIIVDDGSTDPATRHLFDSYRREKTRLFRIDNSGLARARNFGMHQARGRYVTFLDADDVLDPTFLSMTVARLEADPSLAFASCWMKAFGAAEFSWRPTSCDFPRLLVEDTVCTAALTRRDALESIGAFDAHMPVAGYEDWDVAIGLVARGLHGVIVPEYLFRYRIRDGSMSQQCTEPANHARLMRYLVDKHEASYCEHLPGVLQAIEDRALELEQGVRTPVSTTDQETRARLVFLETTLRTLIESRAWRSTGMARGALSGLRRAAAAATAAARHLSVVVDVAGSAHDLRRTVDGLTPLLGEAEIILVDAGAADPLVREMLRWYAGAGMEVIHVPGAVAARTAGLRRARGLAVFAVTAGDTVNADVLRAAVQRIQRDEAAFVCCGLHDEGTGFTWLAASARMPGVLACTRVPFPVVRRDVLERCGGYSSRMPTMAAADLELHVRLAGYGVPGSVLEQALVQVNTVATRADAGPPEHRYRGVARPVYEVHRAVVDADWKEVVLGQENQRRRLEAHFEARNRPPSPAAGNDVHWGTLRRVEPISLVWGLDRGKPVDRYYIEAFLQRHAADIQGRVLEVKDAGYTRAFGSGVAQSDVVDIAEGNAAATIIGDLREPGLLPAAAFDCVIITQTLHIIYEMSRVIANLAAALRPGGVLLATLPCVSRIDYEHGLDSDFWRVTPASARRLFGDVFGEHSVEVNAYGNVLVCNAFLLGLAADDLTAAEFDHHDPYFPLVVGVRARVPE